MSILFKEQFCPDSYIVDEIENHPAWHRSISGLEAEKLLKAKKIPYLYLLRTGECRMNYYVSFVHPDGSIRHQPFLITMGSGVWSFTNGSPSPLFKEETFADVLNQMVYCKKEELLAKVSNI